MRTINSLLVFVGLVLWILLGWKLSVVVVQALRYCL